MFKRIELGDFAKHSKISLTKYLGEWKNAEAIVSLRDITEILSMQAMPVEYLESLLYNVGLTSDPDRKPYKGCTISFMRLDPRSVKVGQTFIEREKYCNFLESFSNLFNGFCVSRGVAKCTAYIILGKTRDNMLCIAHYLPSIIEVHDNVNVLLDGVHRNYLVMNIGTTQEAIFVNGVKEQFPCALQTWDRVSVVTQKPPLNERYFDLKEHLFRDVKFLGIDG